MRWALWGVRDNVEFKNLSKTEIYMDKKINKDLLLHAKNQ